MDTSGNFGDTVKSKHSASRLSGISSINPNGLNATPLGHKVADFAEIVQNADSP
jgi:hypothetical protein